MEGLHHALRRMKQSKNPVVSSYANFGIMQDIAKFGDVNALETGLRVFDVEGGVTEGNFRWPPLVCAVDGGRDACVAFLIHRKADMNWKDQFGYSALSYAAMSGNPKVMSLLLKESSKELIEHKNVRNQTALDVATEQRQDSCARLLLEAYTRASHESCLHEWTNTGFNEYSENCHDMLMGQILAAPAPVWNNHQQLRRSWHRRKPRSRRFYTEKKP